MADHGGILVRGHAPDILRSHTEAERTHGYDSQDGTGTDRLCQKKLLSYVIDEHDARIYIYTPLKSREACLEEKSRRFADSYFSGSHANAAAALLKHAVLTEAQMEELKGILETCREKKTSKGKDL